LDDDSALKPEGQNGVLTTSSHETPGVASSNNQEALDDVSLATVAAGIGNFTTDSAALIDDKSTVDNPIATRRKR